MTFNPRSLSTYPTSSGVYLMRNKKRAIIYVGKAKNIQQRLKQYFSHHQERPCVPYLLSQLASIDVIVTRSEKEALLLENSLIKTHQPKYNILLKDDKSPFYFQINTNKKWPRIECIRRPTPPPKGVLRFGPYFHSAKKMKQFVHQLFPLRQCSDRELTSRTRPCLLYQMNRCIAPCLPQCDQQEYRRLVHQAIAFFQGKTHSLLQQWEKKMEAASRACRFEEAQEYFLQIQMMKKQRELQGDSSIENLPRQSIDFIGFHREKETMAFAVVIVRQARVHSVDSVSFTSSLQEPQEALESFLLQRYSSLSVEMPARLCLPFDSPHLEEIQQLFVEKQNGAFSLQIPQRGKKRQLLDMANHNAAIYSRFYSR